MKKDIHLMALFGGTGGFAKGLQDAGFNIKTHLFSEVDSHAIANYKYNFKNAQHIGSVTDICTANITRPDIITFGSPCQDFSMAGHQTGLDGERSVLILEAIRIVRELKPPVFIWENVKGTFSSNKGADFWAIIAAFTNIGGYRLEWQLLNTSWFLPQNRERIYLIGHFAGSSQPGVFPFGENDRLFSIKTQPEKRWSQTKDSGTLGTGTLRATDTFISIPHKAGCLTGGGNSGGLHSDMTVIPIATNNKNGYDNMTENESLDFSHLKSKTQAVIHKKNYAQWDQSGKGHNSQQNRAFYDTGNMGTIPSSRTDDKVKILLENTQIRRLTEIECERLQGYPDDWTKYGIYEKKVWINKKEGTFEIVEGLREIPRTQRYKLCGNAVTTTVVKAIGQRLRLIEH